MATKPPDIWHRMCNGFVPIEAPNENTKTKALVDQVVIKDGSTEAFAYISLKQYRHSVAKNPQSQTWAVVNTNLEASLLQHDLGQIRRNNTPAVVLKKDEDTSSRSGKLCVLTFATLKQHLVRHNEGAHRLPHDLTLLLNFGCGYIEFDMALCSTLMLKLIASTSWNGKRNGLAMCTVSTIDHQLFGRDWPPRCLYEVDQPEDPNTSSLSRYQWHNPPGGSTTQAVLVKLLELDRSSDGKGTITSMPPHKFSVTQNLDAKKVKFHADGADTNLVLSEKYSNEARHLVIDPMHSTYYGPVNNIGHVLIDHYSEDWVRDKRTGRPVAHDAVPLTQPEILMASRFKGMDGQTPQVHCFMAFQTFSALPRMPVASLAHTIDLGKLLLLSIRAWEESKLSVMEMPVLLPQDEFAVEEELRFLRVKGLIKQVSLYNDPWMCTGRELAYGVLQLTRLGIKTVEFLYMSDMQSLHLAIFMAALPSAPSPAVREAALSIASVIELDSGISSIGVTLDTSEATRQELANLDYLKLTSFAAQHTRRGPIWLAMAVWHKAMNDITLRNFQMVYDAGKDSGKISLHHPNVLDFSPQRSYMWDDRLDQFARVFAGGVPNKDHLFKQILTKQELLELESALVVAHMDKLALVPMQERGLPFAFDLVSGQPLLAPHRRQHCQLDIEYCRKSERLPNGKFPDYIVCIYSSLDDGNKYSRSGLIANDLTFVSWRAVGSVLARASGDFPWQTCLQKIQSRMALQWPIGKKSLMSAPSRPVTKQPLPDVRMVARGDEAHLVHALTRTWPTIPGRPGSSHETSAIDCVAILLRLAFAVFIKIRPDTAASQQSALMQYVWTYFDHTTADNTGAIDDARNLALCEMRKTLPPNSEVTFDKLCRSSLVVAALWINEGFQVESPWFICNPGFTETRSSAQLAEDPAPVWDGESTIEDFVTNLSYIASPRGPPETKTWVYFNTPLLLHIDLVPSPTARVSLQDGWRIWTDIWEASENTDKPDTMRIQHSGKAGYVIGGIVRHAKRRRNPDQIRLFRANGVEIVPDTLADAEATPDWGFKLHDPVPQGERLSLFYVAWPGLDKAKPQERRYGNGMEKEVSKGFGEIIEQF
ncbi:hypothetical protein N0V82_010112 [Gnomoniopsis sp. IMI 355080]|nr:hypothetical protein N0V82_010112 [Gnomoniopsis sp. IMI 355080]